VNDPKTDSTALAEFASTRSPDAFALLVRRYVDLVYATARRIVGDRHLADEITNASFIVLARKVHRIHARTLPGWLVNTTRLAAKQALRAQSTRRRHEAQAARMREEAQLTSDQPTAREILPLLDDALSRLSESDRTAVVMRFLQGRSFLEVSQAMGATEEAARKRASRAVEKLRAIFMKQGVMPSAGGLMLILAAQQARAAPAAILSATTTASAGGALPAIKLLAQKVASTMIWTSVKPILLVILALAFVGAAGAGLAAARRRSGQQLAVTPTSVPSISHGPATRPADPATVALLQQLKALRAAAIKNSASGRGVAELDSNEMHGIKPPPGVAEPKVALPPHKVQFAFTGDQFIVTGTDRFNADARMNRDGVMYRYYAGRAAFPAPAALLVEQEPSLVLYDPMLENWSFQGIAQLPPQLRVQTEAELFDRLPGFRDFTIVQDGDLLRISCNKTGLLGPVSATTFQCNMEFDMRMSGMLTGYVLHIVKTDPKSGKTTDISVNWTLTWARARGHVIPKSRKAGMVISNNGRLNNSQSSNVTFEKFSIEPVDVDKELTIDRMGIRPGTPVAVNLAANSPASRKADALLDASNELRHHDGNQ
jgi:RNA polymerase sigma factor (sigma-70 family)